MTVFDPQANLKLKEILLKTIQLGLGVVAHSWESPNNRASVREGHYFPHKRRLEGASQAGLVGQFHKVVGSSPSGSLFCHLWIVAFIFMVSDSSWGYSCHICSASSPLLLGGKERGETFPPLFFQVHFHCYFIDWNLVTWPYQVVGEPRKCSPLVGW